MRNMIEQYIGPLSIEVDGIMYKVHTRVEGEDGVKESEKAEVEKMRVAKKFLVVEEVLTGTIFDVRVQDFDTPADYEAYRTEHPRDAALLQKYFASLIQATFAKIMQVRPPID